MTNTEVLKNLTDTEVLFLTLIGEARGEPVEGQIAVANIILNRSKTRKVSIKNVCLQKSQFSCWNENDPNYAVLMELGRIIINSGFKPYEEYAQLNWIVDGIMANKVADNTKNRDHYMTAKLFLSDKKPSWAKNPKSDPIKFGNHVFFNV